MKFSAGAAVYRGVLDLKSGAALEGNGIRSIRPSAWLGAAFGFGLVAWLSEALLGGIGRMDVEVVAAAQSLSVVANVGSLVALMAGWWKVLSPTLVRQERYPDGQIKSYVSSWGASWRLVDGIPPIKNSSMYAVGGGWIVNVLGEARVVDRADLVVADWLNLRAPRRWVYTAAVGVVLLAFGLDVGICVLMFSNFLVFYDVPNLLTTSDHQGAAVESPAPNANRILTTPSVAILFALW